MATTEALSMLAGRGEGRPWTREAAHPGRVRMRIKKGGFYSQFAPPCTKPAQQSYIFHFSPFQAPHL